MAEDMSSGCFHCAKRRVDVRGIDQAETEMRDASDKTSLGRFLFKDEHVQGTGCLSLNEAVFFIDCDDAKDSLIELQGALGIPNSKSDVR